MFREELTQRPSLLGIALSAVILQQRSATQKGEKPYVVLGAALQKVSWLSWRQWKALFSLQQKHLSLFWPTKCPEINAWWRTTAVFLAEIKSSLLFHQFKPKSFLLNQEREREKVSEKWVSRNRGQKGWNVKKCSDNKLYFLINGFIRQMLLAMDGELGLPFFKPAFHSLSFTY